MGEKCDCNVSVHGDATLSLDQFLEQGGLLKVNHCPLHAAAPRLAAMVRQLEPWVSNLNPQKEDIRALLAEIDRAGGGKEKL